MKLNKKYFLATFTALGIQAIFGFNSAIAVPCEVLINERVKADKDYLMEATLRAKQQGIKGVNYTYDHSSAEFDNVQSFWYTSVDDFWPKLKAYLADRGYPSGKRITKDAHFIKHVFERKNLEGYKLESCYAQALLDANGDIDAIINGSSTNNSTSNQSSNQSSSSTQSNSPESYNIQVSQTNKQNYQAVQRAYEQANAGKGKKNNLQAVGTECMKNNPSQKSFTNKCNQAINFAYCFSGIVPGYKNENPETLAEMSCQNGQFGTLTLGAGESIPGSYRGMVLEGVGCKSPSQPVGMKYNTSEPANGRCSY